MNKLPDNKSCHVIKKEYIIEPKLHNLKKSINVYKVLEIFDKIDKLKKYICNEVFDKIFQNVFWKELNIVDIEPINILCSILLLQRINAETKKLSHLIVTPDKRKALKYKDYIMNQIKSAISTYIITDDINSTEFSDKLMKYREELNPNMLFFLSSFSEAQNNILVSLYKNVTFKDYLLLIVHIYQSSLVENLYKRIAPIMQKHREPINFKESLIKAYDGEWHVAYNEPFFEVKFILKRPVRVQFGSSITTLEEGAAFNLVKYYLPSEEYFFSLLQQSGYTVINAYNEESTSLATFLCKKIKKSNTC
jgi:hypothetical protein